MVRCPLLSECAIGAEAMAERLMRYYHFDFSDIWKNNDGEAVLRAVAEKIEDVLDRDDATYLGLSFYSERLDLRRRDRLAGMNLIDLVEMLCDWSAAVMRHDDGDLDRSLAVNAERFDIGRQLAEVLRSTVRDFPWLKDKFG